MAGESECSIGVSCYSNNQLFNAFTAAVNKRKMAQKGDSGRCDNDNDKHIYIDPVCRLQSYRGAEKDACSRS